MMVKQDRIVVWLFKKTFPNNDHQKSYLAQNKLE